MIVTKIDYFSAKERKPRTPCTHQQKTALIEHLKDNAASLMGKLKMGNGLSKGEQDKAWTDFFNKAKNEIGVKYRDEEHLQGSLINEFHEIHHVLVY